MSVGTQRDTGTGTSTERAITGRAKPFLPGPGSNGPGPGGPESNGFFAFAMGLCGNPW